MSTEWVGGEAVRQENGRAAGAALGAVVGGSIGVQLSGLRNSSRYNRRGREVARWLLLVLWLEWAVRGSEYLSDGLGGFRIKIRSTHARNQEAQPCVT